jgi:hypothetical protein
MNARATATGLTLAGARPCDHRDMMTRLAAATVLLTATVGLAPTGARSVPRGTGGAPRSLHLQAPPPQVPSPQAVVDRLSFDRYRNNVAQLAGFGTRYWRSAGNRQARDWIEAELASFGYAVQRHPIRVAAPLDQLLDTGADSVYVTKVGTLHPDRMYIVSAHMDSINTESPDHGFAPGADDDGSGTSLVLELARVFAAADIETEVSVRFILWNAEEIGLVGSRTYVRDRQPLQGIEDPPGSGRFPEPHWLGIIQHDMLLFDHGLPDPATGMVADRQIADADVDIEYDAANTAGGGAMVLASMLLAANARYGTLYPAEVGQFMCCTDSVPFAPFVPAVSVRENERRAEIGRGANPHWHKSSDVFATYREEDFRLGFTALRMTGGALAELAGARITGR